MRTVTTDQTGRMLRLISLRWEHMPFCWFCHEVAHIVMHPKDADRMANRVDPDQTLLSGAV